MDSLPSPFSPSTTSSESQSTPSRQPSPLPSYIVRLPEEVWIMICEHISRDDLRNTRFVCQKLEPPAAVVLFRDIHLCTYLKSFGKLENISKHPAFRRYVRRLYYDGWAVEDNVEKHIHEPWIGTTSLKEYLSMAGNPFQKRDKAMYNQEMDTFHHRRDTFSTAVREHRLRQNYLRPRSGKMLNDSLSKFSGLHKIYLEQSHSSKSKAWKVKDINILCPGLLEMYLDEYFVEPMDDSHIQNILTAITMLNLDIHKLSVSAYTLQNWFTAVESLPSGRVSNLHNLQKLELKFEIGDTIEDQEVSNFHYVFEHMKFLEDIELSVRQSVAPRMVNNAVRLKDFIRLNHHWEYLYRLSLHKIRKSSSHFRAVLVSHSKSLQILKLVKVEFVNVDEENLDSADSWIDFLQYLHDSLRLRKVSFDGYLKDPHMDWTARRNNDNLSDLLHQIEAYVTHKGPFSFSPLIQNGLDYVHDDESESDENTEYVSHSLPWTWIADNSWQSRRRRHWSFQ